MDLKAAREAVGLSQRELAHKTGLNQTKLSRIEAGERDATEGEEALIAIALTDREATQEPTDPEPQMAPPREHRAQAGVRRVFVCQKCRRRKSLHEKDPASQIPECDEHGPMVRQANHPYMGQSTEPPKEWGWPRAVDGVERRDEAMRRVRERV